MNHINCDGFVPKKMATDDLREWWLALAANEADSVLPKTAEYGAGKSGNLEILGMCIGALAGLPAMSRAEMIEMACAFYLQSKVSRWLTALKNGQRASDDTLHDIACYLKMAQRTREVGGWPDAPA